MNVRDLTREEFARFCGMEIRHEFWGYAARDGVKTIALGGVLKSEDGKWWGFLDQLPTRHGGYLYRHAIHVLKRAAEEGISEVYVLRDPGKTTSQRLLERLGFEPTGEMQNEFEVWKWLIRSHS